MRKGDAQFVFDIELALKQTDEKPGYYVQYAHPRIAGIFRTAVERDALSDEGVDLECLADVDEHELMRWLAEYPKVVATAAATLGPHRIIGYLESVARRVNGWYHRHRVFGDDGELMAARLCLARAAQIVLANGLTLLGISAPERM